MAGFTRIGQMDNSYPGSQSGNGGQFGGSLSGSQYMGSPSYNSGMAAANSAPSLGGAAYSTNSTPSLGGGNSAAYVSNGSTAYEGGGSSGGFGAGDGGGRSRGGGASQNPAMSSGAQYSTPYQAPNNTANGLMSNGSAGVANPYSDQLNSLLSNPSGFSGTPGFQFALNTGLQGVERGMSSQRGSGNALAALSQYGTGLAQQDYGNQVDRLGKLSGQQQQYDLGLGQNVNSSNRNYNDLTLGLGQNENNRVNNANNFSLGQVRNANDATRNANDFSLGTGRNQNDANKNSNDYNLGQGQNANSAQNSYWNYENNNQQNANNAARNQNDFNSGMYRNNTDQYNAETNRSNGQQNNYLNMLRLRSGK